MLHDSIATLSIKLDDLIKFGFSISTSKKVIKGLREKGGLPSLARPAHGITAAHVPRGISPQEISAGAMQIGVKPHYIRPNSVVIPRRMEFNPSNMSPLDMMLHESGHAADPRGPAYTEWRRKAASAFQDASNRHDTAEVERRGKGLASSVINSELRANKEALAQIEKHGKPEEITRWKKMATDQMRKGYQVPLFQEAGAGTISTISEGKEIVRQAPFLRKKYIKLAARWGNSSVRYMKARLDNLIEFALNRKDAELAEALVKHGMEGHAKRIGLIASDYVSAPSAQAKVQEAIKKMKRLGVPQV